MSLCLFSAVRRSEPFLQALLDKFIGQQVQYQWMMLRIGYPSLERPNLVLPMRLFLPVTLLPADGSGVSPVRHTSV